MEIIFKRAFHRFMKIPKDIKATLRKDYIILNDLDRPTAQNHINLHWCSEKRADGKENTGDYLAVPIFNFMMKKYELDPNKLVSQTTHLYTVGSILFFGHQDAVIWGSGLLSDPVTFRKKSKVISLDIRAVRGPRTRHALLKQGYKCPEIYGDPAILMPLIYQPSKKNVIKEYSVILHKSSKKQVQNQIDIITNDYRNVIDQIVSSKKVISSTLHGIILAEAYGVEAVLVADDRKDFNYFKYDDYYHSTRRMNYPIAKTVNEGIEIQAVSLPNLEQLQKNLIASFPTDLWR